MGPCLCGDTYCESCHPGAAAAEAAAERLENAAPKLLKALKSLVGCFDETRSFNETGMLLIDPHIALATAREAIAEAETPEEWDTND